VAAMAGSVPAATEEASVVAVLPGEHAHRVVSEDNFNLNI